jgi:TonB family protein
MTDYTTDIKRYLSGEMTAAEMQALEKRALSDPFLAEALEGASQFTPADFSNDVAALNDEIDERNAIEMRKAAASKSAVLSGTTAAEVPGIRPVSHLRWVFRIAAGLVLLALATFTIWNFIKEPTPDTLALNEVIKEQLPAGNDEAESEQELPAEPSAEQAAPVKPDESSRAASTYPADTKSTDRIAVDRETAKALETPAAERQAAPVLAEAPKGKEQPLPESEKAVELAIADNRQEEGKLEKRDQLADERKKATGVVRSDVSQKRNIIQGQVTSAEDGSPLPGVNVVIKGTTIGTVTDAAGNFQLASDLASPSLVFSFIGLQSQEVAVNEQKPVDVKMTPDAAQLSEVVVTGYGIQHEDYPPVVQLAHPVTGNRAFKQYLEKNIRYPKEAVDKKVEGRVTVEFTVEPNGSLTNFVVVRGIGVGCDEELIRLVREGPKWEPTRKDGTAVRDKVRVRLKFDLPGK